MPGALGRVQAASTLFRAATERSALDDLLTARLNDALGRISLGSVTPDLDMPHFRRELSEFDFASPRRLEDLFDWVIGQLEHGVVHLTHPRYFGLFNPAPSFASECAERIVAGFNPQLASAATSPVAVEIEAHVIKAVALRAGLPASAQGHFTSGGSEANFAALTCALTSAHPDYAEAGARAFGGAPTVYVSEDAHMAWAKIVHQAGLGRSSLRLVGTDASGRMAPLALAETIAADRARGCIPVMIAATAGTTGLGAIDPIAQSAAIARGAGLWLHVDAAWGGALIASQTLCRLLAGIELADSLTIDAHKWFATTMACGMFLIRHPTILAEAFQVAAAASSFMPSNRRGLDPYVTTAQWSRRFLGLRLFLSLASAGWQGHAAHVERAVALTEMLKRRLAARGWTVINDPQLAVLCVEPPPGCAGAADIASAVVRSGAAWITTTLWRGRPVIRICITNGQTGERDIDALAEILQARAERASCTPPIFAETPGARLDETP